MEVAVWSYEVGERCDLHPAADPADRGRARVGSIGMRIEHDYDATHLVSFMPVTHLHYEPSIVGPGFEVRANRIGGPLL